MPNKAQNNAFSTLKLIAKQNFKKLALTFSLVLAENALFLLYPIFAGFAINKILNGETVSAMIYAVMVIAGWVLGATRRRVDTQVFAGIYANLAVNVVLNERKAGQDGAVTAARVTLSREFVDFFEEHFPILFTSAISIAGAAAMLLLIEPVVGLSCVLTLAIFGLFLPNFIKKNDRLYFRLNNRLEREVERVKNAREYELKRHYGLVSRLRVAISNREAIGYLTIGIAAFIMFSTAIVMLSASQSPNAGHIYSVMTYLWTFAISLDDAPRLIEQFSKLKDIGRRVNIEIGDEIAGKI